MCQSYSQGGGFPFVHLFRWCFIRDQRGLKTLTCCKRRHDDNVIDGTITVCAHQDVWREFVTYSRRTECEVWSVECRVYHRLDFGLCFVCELERIKELEEMNESDLINYVNTSSRQCDTH